MSYRVLVFFSAFVVLSRCQFDKELGDACRNNGTCKRLSDCPVESELMQRNSELVYLCGFDSRDGTVIVCCENRATISRRGKGIRDLSISEKKCEEYAKYVFVKEPSIVNPHATKGTVVSHCARDIEVLINGGKPALPKEFPHMAEIGYGRQPTVSFQCGGSLISERWVLSAAHCSYIEKLGRPKLARIGDLDNTINDDGARPVIVKIVKTVNHPDYKTGNMYDDIALYQLQKDVSFSPYIRPLCLQVNYLIGRHNAIAIGFGHLNFGGDYYHFLQKVDLNFVDSQNCSKALGVFKGLTNGIDDSRMLCAGDEEGKDTCKGDSGSSLSVRLHEPYCMFSQVGITSFGRPCGQGYPGVYTRVSHYVPWIEGIVWPEETKKKADMR